MAHYCPDCGRPCHCGGDSDDAIFDDPVREPHCTHCDYDDSDVFEDDLEDDDDRRTTNDATR